MLLVDHGEDPRLAVPTVAAIELVVVMASLARRCPAVLASHARPGVTVDAVPPVPSVGGQGAEGEHHSPAETLPIEPVEVVRPAAAAASRPGPDGGVPVGRDEDAAGDGVVQAAQDVGAPVGDDAFDGADVPAVPSHPDVSRDPVPEAVRWAVREQRAGRDPGWRAVQERFPEVSKRDALKAAKDARDRVAGRLHAVG